LRLGYTWVLEIENAANSRTYIFSFLRHSKEKTKRIQVLQMYQSVFLVRYSEILQYLSHRVDAFPAHIIGIVSTFVVLADFFHLFIKAPDPAGRPYRHLLYTAYSRFNR